jgi:hypothetical protein
MNSPHLAKSAHIAPTGLQPGNNLELPSGWRQYASHAHGLTFRYPSGSSIARQANYLFLSVSSDPPCDPEPADSTRQLVVDLTPIHLYPYNDLKEYLEKTRKRPVPGTDTEVKALPGGYLAGRLSRPCCTGKDFFLFYIGKGNLAYTLTVAGKELLTLAEEIIASIRFR